MGNEVGGEECRPAAPAGWYPDASGVLRWWDGHGWIMAARGAGQERTWALLSHLSLFVMPLFAAIVLRVTVGRVDRFARHHTTEALNAQIWFAVVWNALLLPLIIIMWEGGDPPVWALLGPVFGFMAFATTASLAIRGRDSGFEGRLVALSAALQFRARIGAREQRPRLVTCMEIGPPLGRRWRGIGPPDVLSVDDR